MSGTLDFVACSLTRARRFHHLDRGFDALPILRQLALFPDLPADTAAEIHERLADIYLHRGQSRIARRHVRHALRHRPDHAAYYHLLGQAWEQGRRPDLARARRAYRRALQLDPERPETLAALGQVAVQLGRVREGARALRRAATLRPDDSGLLGRLAEALVAAGQSRSARRLLRDARFAHARDGRFRAVWDRFRFGQVAAAQAVATTGEGAAAPAVLPFEAAIGGRTAVATPTRVLRYDPASRPRPHLRASGRRNPNHAP